MASEISTCIIHIKPIYNLIFVTIAVILFIILFKKKKKNMAPWKLIFVAVLIYVVEQILSALAQLNILPLYPRILNSFFEMAIATIFIYVLLKQKELIKK